MTIVQLQRAIEQDDSKAVIKQCKGLLQDPNHSKEHVTLLTTLIVALCKDQQFEEAIKLSEDQSIQSLLFPRAYALYKTKRLDECRKLLSSSQSPANHHLAAQLNYRAADFDDAANIYQKQFKSNEISSDPELATNVLSCLIAQGNIAAQKSFIEQHDFINNPPTYELLYNAACSMIEAGDLIGADNALSRAHKMATTALQGDELSASEIDDELAVIKCQQAFIKQILGHSSSAVDMYTEILHSHVSDTSVRAVASNNSLCVHSSDSRVFDSLKRSNKATQSLNFDEDKLTPKQKVVLAFNRVIALVAAKQWTNANQQIDTLDTLTDDSTKELCVLARAAVAHTAKSGDARNMLETFVKLHPKQSIECQLVLAHLDLIAGHTESARSRLASITASEMQLRRSSVFVDTNGKIDFQHRPAVVAALCALDDKLEQSTKSIARVDDAITQWRGVVNQSDSSRRVYSNLLERAADWNLEHQRGDHASALLKQLAAEGENRMTSSKAADASQIESIAKLAIATAKADPQAAALLASKLPIPAGVASIDITALETAAAPELAKKKRGTDESTTDNSKSFKSKKKRKRAPRYPKGFDPTNPSNPPPDAQRWLPKWERTNLKGKKSNKNPLRGAQGSTSTVAPVVATSTPTPQPQVSAAAKKAANKRKGK